MRKLVGILLTFMCAAVLLAQGVAQQPPAQDKGKDFSTSSIVTGMMAFDKNKTGKLTKEMVTDPRLHRLFDQADANKDGVVTKEELIALAAKLDAEYGPGGKGGFGKGKGGKGPKGKGGLGKGPPGKDAPDKGPPDKGPPDKGAIPGKGASSTRPAD